MQPVTFVSIIRSEQNYYFKLNYIKHIGLNRCLQQCLEEVAEILDEGVEVLEHVVEVLEHFIEVLEQVVEVLEEVVEVL